VENHYDPLYKQKILIETMRKSPHTIFLSISNDDHSNVMDGTLLSLERMRDFRPGKNVSFHNERVIQGTVNDGQSTFPFLRDGMDKCGC
jgi:hypothetical protein